MQETLLRAWRSPQVLEQATGSARGWLFTVAKRIVIDEWRTARSRRERVSAELPEQPVADATEQVDRQLRRRAGDSATVGRTPGGAARVLLPRFVGRRGRRRARHPARHGEVAHHYALRALRLALDEIGGVR